MKILKIIGIVMVSLIALFFIVSALLPSDYRVERSIVINKPVSTVYNEVRCFKNFNYWSPWYKLDTAATIEITGIDGEVGAKYSWSSKNEAVGTGSLTRIQQEENKLVLSELYFAGFGSTSQAGFAFEEVEGGTKVTWFNSGSLRLTVRIFGLMMDGTMGKAFGEGLEKMKAHIESLPEEATLPEIKIEEKVTVAVPAFTIKATCKASEIGPTLGKLYGEIGIYIKESGLEMTGAPFAIYHKWAPPDTVELEAGVQLNKAGKSKGSINATQLTAANTVVAYFYGPYEKTELAHAAIDKYITEHGKKIIGSPWEIYVTDPTTVDDPNKVLTEIYYPVE